MRETYQIRVHLIEARALRGSNAEKGYSVAAVARVRMTAGEGEQAIREEKFSNTRNKSQQDKVAFILPTPVAHHISNKNKMTRFLFSTLRYLGLIQVSVIISFELAPSPSPVFCSIHQKHVIIKNLMEFG